MTLTQDTAHLNRFYGWLNSLPIPQTKIALGVILAFGTFVVDWILMLMQKPIPDGPTATLLGFCVAVLGIASWDYKTKRGSDLDAIAAKGDADAKVAAATPAVVTMERPALPTPPMA